MAKKKVEVPKSIEQASELIRKIREHQRALERIQTRLNERIEDFKSQAIAESGPHQEMISQFFKGIFIFAQENRNELTEKGKKKTVHLLTGDILWRMTPPAVSLRNVKRIITLCKRRRLRRFIRVKEEVDKEAMLREPELAIRIDGVKIGQKEEFVVKSAEVVEIVGDTKKLQKVLSKR